ncbi:cobalamin B12-binding domain-containing protein [Jannaschia sp. S6380]|uniref:cobalamin B12-binding domain-containing protein n=1 Tax=Jannaschia sp. S6380 TaxID=2926408 RepID=UPI001FF2211E|nr:cobalamin B12-binding domain-containing protein [Jannaschia sp. S6380]MCK0167664.1 cobalamin B12-binding domain-containing protein [Jannaschia sp. S6380]
MNDVARSRQPRPKVNAGLVERLLDAALGRTGESYRTVTRRMLALGIAPEVIADRYIPIVARRMGEEWVNDNAGFATVSIGGTRLQAMLRELSTCWSADRMGGDGKMTSAAMVIVPQNAHHTLGATVLSTQLRRAGLSVRLCIGMDPRALKVTADNGDFDTVIISASLGDRIDGVRTMVDIVRSGGRAKTPPVIVGGTILEQNMDIQRRTGADLATANLCDAMDFCDLPAPRVYH